MSQEQELIEHQVEIDKYISATIRIPKVLTALELKSLMSKANKLFNLAEVPMVTTGNLIAPKRQYNKLRTNYFMFTPEMEEFLINNYSNKLPFKKLTKRFNKAYDADLTVVKVTRKVYALRDKGLLRKQRRKSITYSQEEVDRANELINIGKGGTEIYDILSEETGRDYNKKGVADFVNRLKNKMKEEIKNDSEGFGTPIN